MIYKNKIPQEGKADVMLKKSIGFLIIMIMAAVNCYAHCSRCELLMAKATRDIIKQNPSNAIREQNPSNAEKNIIELPAPDLKGTVSVEEAIFKRTSVKDFKDKSLTLKEVSQLLWAAGGKTIDGTTGATRSYPSAGGIYPLEIYLVAGDVDGLKAGIYFYRWQDHSIKLVKEGDFRRELRRAAMGQRMVLDAPGSIVWTVIVSRTTKKIRQARRNSLCAYGYGRCRTKCSSAGGSPGFGYGDNRRIQG